MKYLVIIPLFVVLIGCATTSPERLERAEKYENRSKSASQRALKIGSRAGTPENIESMERAYEESSYYKKKAHHEKYNDTWFSLFVALIFGFPDD